MALPEPAETWEAREKRRWTEQNERYKKPVAVKTNIKRKCLKCGKDFIAEHQWIFMCRRDTKGNESNSWS